MRRLFGTDGIRGVANQYPMTPQMAINVGRAVANKFSQRDQKPRVVIGKDTRESGSMLEHALASGICSVGGNAFLAGVLPTPAVAFLTRSMEFDAGIVISASHNPFEDNGIKLFGANGYKLSDEIELELEKTILADDNTAEAVVSPASGCVHLIQDAASRYVSFAKGVIGQGNSLKGLSVVLDCANGAGFQVGPAAFKDLGAEVRALFTSPDGRNINLNCGSQHPEVLAAEVVKLGADAGFAFDGDADRVIAVDELGNIITGDQILAICAKIMKAEGRLRNNIVVSTVMSNLGLRGAMDDLGIAYSMTHVGDRYVLQEMVEKGAQLGGEDSGHMIFLEHHTTGDGLITALNLADALKKSKKKMSELAALMKVFPQRLVNVQVKAKPRIETVPELMAAINRAEQALGEHGRVLVRYSGTQNLCRVMVEAPTNEETEKHCLDIADVIRKVLA